MRVDLLDTHVESIDTAQGIHVTMRITERHGHSVFHWIGSVQQGPSGLENIPEKMAEYQHECEWLVMQYVRPAAGNRKGSAEHGRWRYSSRPKSSANHRASAK
jgi:hypothetical protein